MARRGARTDQPRDDDLGDRRRSLDSISIASVCASEADVLRVEELFLIQPDLASSLASKNRFNSAMEFSPGLRPLVYKRRK
ncbi:hypothetical protein [Methylocystis iwaonis]|uniref:hypothetical protein n=1 Tax=Methylocystis iwaonis TaxID=2885079 RepID=UPI002E7BE304|nr:hypothetical protein [Methylocystis iwaonis]